MGSGQMKKGWFPIQSAMPLIDAGAVPLYVSNVSKKKITLNIFSYKVTKKYQS